MLTGRNHHTVATGVIQEIATGYPGYSGIIPKSCATFAELLKQAGYTNAWFGKNHNVPDNQTSPAGPFDNWPTNQGFDHFYGFIGGETDQFYPSLVRNTTPVEPPYTPEEGYQLTRDLADDCIQLDARAEGHRTRTPLPGLLLHRLRPCPAPAAPGLARAQRGPLRHGLGRVPPRRVAEPDRRRHHPARHEAHRAAGARSRPGTTIRTSRKRSSPARPRSTPTSWSTRTTKWAGWSTPSRSWASSTTRSSSTSWATTAAAQRARWSARPTS